MEDRLYFSDYERMKKLHDELDKLLDEFLEYPLKYSSFELMDEFLKKLFHKYELDEFQYKIVKEMGVFDLEPIRPIDRYIYIAIMSA